MVTLQPSLNTVLNKNLLLLVVLLTNTLTVEARVTLKDSILKMYQCVLHTCAVAFLVSYHLNKFLKCFLDTSEYETHSLPSGNLNLVYT